MNSYDYAKSKEPSELERRFVDFVVRDDEEKWKKALKRIAHLESKVRELEHQRDEQKTEADSMRKQIVDAIAELPHVAGPLAHRIRFQREQYDGWCKQYKEERNQAERDRDEAGRRYVTIAGDLHEAQGRIAELGGELAQVQRQNEAAQQGFNQLLADNAHLREYLRRVEWVDGLCPACERFESGVAIKPELIGHAPDCWLAQALREGE